MKKYLKLVLILIIAGLIWAFIHFDLQQYLTLDFIREKRGEFEAYYEENQTLTIAAFLGIYITATAISIPGATILTLTSGAIFGLVLGSILVSIASTIGATLAFLGARFLFKDAIQKKYSKNLKTINKRIEIEGGFYLFALRLVPAFPFFVINMVMGLSTIKTKTYMLVSWIGMLPATIIYVNAGTQLIELKLTFGLFASFAALGLFPFVIKKVMERFKK